MGKYYGLKGMDIVYIFLLVWLFLKSSHLEKINMYKHHSLYFTAKE